MNNPHIQRILLLGHSGFIGSHLARVLKATHGSLEVVGRSPATLDLASNASQSVLDGLLDARTAVVMLAAVKRQFGDNLDAYSRNMAMITNLSGMLHERPVARLIYFSSAAVYGEESHDTRITEQTCVSPMSYYGAAKFAGECVLRRLAAARPGMSLLCLRPPLIYGPGDKGETYGPSGFIRAALRGSRITMWGDGTELREFVYVEDLAAIVAQLVLSDVTGVLNVASGTSYSFTTALDLLGKLISPGPEIGSRPRTKQSVDNAFVNDRMRAVLPEQHFTSLEDGMRRTVLAEREAARA